MTTEIFEAPMPYIISSHRFHEHEDWESVLAEVDRLQAANPGQSFRVYKVRGVPATVVARQAECRRIPERVS
jgi:hypothetical protein